MPNTGATKTCVNACIIFKAGLCKHIMSSDSKISLLVVDECCEYSVLGYIDLSCSVYGGRAVHVQALVVDNMLDVLLSWSDLVLMGIVYEKFPLPDFCRRTGSACFDSVDEARDALLYEWNLLMCFLTNCMAGILLVSR